ncbi:porin family protein [Chitinophaga barathri]|uniref:PorT family protein n=1 Tax=Chitinophaga barathri TaxID=1647451 RepID=A0A3N4MJL7_9BACT|nr:porin family protein [Chitinophaga barathri]RPD40290.1 PorT family protein [Chitinophaga barathri]
MKKALLSVAALLIAGATFAQTKFGIVAGPSWSSYTEKVGGDKETSDLLTGFRAGITADLQLADEFYIQPSLLYTGKGGKDEILGFDTRLRINYLELPINFMYKPEVGNGNLFIGLGPYLAVGLSGKNKTVLGNNLVENDIEFGDEIDEIKRFDAGANFQVGYELPMGLNFGLFTDLGLINLRGNGDSDNSFRNTAFGVNVGYKFGGQ